MARFLVEAQREFFHEIDYYETRSRTLSVRFVKAVQQASDKIGEAPLAWPVTVVPGVPDGLVRHLPLPPFPHAVIYVTEPVLTIVAVCSGRRRPLYWVKRISRIQ